MPQLDAPVARKAWPTVAEAVGEAGRVVDGEHMARGHSIPIPEGDTRDNGLGRLAGWLMGLAAKRTTECMIEDAWLPSGHMHPLDEVVPSR